MNSTDKKISPALIGDILNIMHNAVFLLDGTSRIVFANSRMAQMFRIRREDLENLHVEELFMPEDRQVLVRNILSLTRRDGELETEAMLRRPDGSTFLGLLACSLFRWDDDQGLAITIHDISKMKTLKQMLRHSERIAFLGRMLDDISHQIRNPILVIGGLAKRIQAGAITPQHAEAITKEAARLEDLLDTLYRFTQLPRPVQRHVRLAELAERATARLREAAEARNASWRSNCPAALADRTVLADADLLLQAVEAIVVNACEAYGATHQGSSVSLEVIETGEPERPHAIKISDQGCGIDSADLPHVFSHFYTKKTRHIGMGLTFARRIVEEQKGQLSIESEAGQGTTVTVHLVGERRRDIRTRMLEP